MIRTFQLMTENKLVVFMASLSVAQYLFLLLLSASVVLEAAASLSWTLTGDSALLHYVAYLITDQDFVPYLDLFEPNLPGTYFFHMAIGYLFGYGDLPFRIVDIAWMLGVFWVTWHLMRPFGIAAAIGACVSYYLIYLGFGPYMALQRDHIAILPVATALYLSFQMPTDVAWKRVRYFSIGVLFAVAGLIKPNLLVGLPVSIALCGIFAMGNKFSLWRFLTTSVKVAGIAASGVAVVLATTLLWLWDIGALAKFIELYREYVPLYASLSGDFEFKTASARLSYNLANMGNLGGFKHLFYLSLLGTIMCFFTAKNWIIRSRALALLAMMLAYILSASVAGKFWPYHWLPFQYFSCLGMAMLLCRTTDTKAPIRQIGFATIGLCLFVAGTLASRPITGHRPLPPLFHLASSEVAEFAEERTRLAFELAEYFRVHSRPEDRIQPLTWVGGAAHAMLLSKRVVATPYITDFQFYHHVNNPFVIKLREDLINRMRAELPEFVLAIYEKPTLIGPHVSYSFPELDSLLAAEYGKVHSGQSYDVYKLIIHQP
jgi:hypothetical protein